MTPTDPGMPAAPADPGDPVDPWALTDVVTRLRRVLRASIRTDYAWEQLPMAQVELLQRLDDEPDLGVRALAERHRLAPNTVSTLIQQLVTAGLVTRTPDVRDRRAVTVRLTIDGHRALAGWRDAHAKRLSHAVEQLPERDQRRIAAALPVLGRLVAELEREESDGPPGSPGSSGSR